MTENMKQLFMRQISHEIRNSILYRKIFNFLSVKGLDNLSIKFKKDAEDEMNHSLWLQDFMEKVNEIVDFIPYSPITEQITLGNFAELALQVELMTTEMLNEMLQESYEIGNSVIITEFLLGTMIKEQIEETEKANKLNDQIKNIGEDVKFLQLYDNTIEV